MARVRSRNRLAPPALVALAAVAASAATAGAQVVTVTAQNRFIEGTAVSTVDGNTTTVGPLRIDAPAGDFGPWISDLTVPGSNMVVSGLQDGGFNGTDTIELSNFQVSLSGGGGGGTSGSGTVTNTFGYSFTVNQASTYTLNGILGSSLPLVISFQLTGPGLTISQDSSAGSTIEFTGATGAMAPGNYTLDITATGTISYEGPGGNGGGAGAQLLSLVITPGTACAADSDGNGQIEPADVAMFVNTWFTSITGGTLEGDFDNNGAVEPADVAAFVSAWFIALTSGC